MDILPPIDLFIITFKLMCKNIRDISYVYLCTLLHNSFLVNSKYHTPFFKSTYKLEKISAPENKDVNPLSHLKSLIELKCVGC